MISRSNIRTKVGTWVDVMTADDLYNGISPNLVTLLLTFEYDYHLR